MKTLVLYCTHKISQELTFFLNHGYYSDPSIDFYICFNNLDIDLTQFTAQPNLFFYKRPNIGYDFAGWNYLLQQKVNDKKLYELYDYFIFINTSCCGPFLPVYEKRHWDKIFTEMITDQVKLVGPTINFHRGKPHVQSYMFCMDKIGFNIALTTGIFSNGYVDKNDVIDNCEVRLSQEIIKAGYQIKSLLKGQQMVNYNMHIGQQSINFPYGIMQKDQTVPNGYFGINIQIYEVIFYKSNRSIMPTTLNKYIEMHNYK